MEYFNSQSFKVQNEPEDFITNIVDKYEYKMNILDFGNNRTYPKTNGASKRLNRTVEKRIEKFIGWERIHLQLSPFFWETPHGLDQEKAKWFWLQSENMRHFLDTNRIITAVTRVIHNGEFDGRFSPLENQTHYTNIVGEPSFCSSPKYDTVFYLTSHQTALFQHFLDNGLNHIGIMLLATGLDPRNVTFIMPEYTTQAIPDILSRWGFTFVQYSGTISAKTLVLPEIVPNIHPLFYDMFIKAMRLNYSNADKIVLVSRTQADTPKYERIIHNQNSLEESLQLRFGDRFIKFVPKKHDLNSTMALFQQALVVIGSHGGGMYNSMFSTPGACIVEIIPVLSNGLYLGQTDGDSPLTFAHLAMYTGAILMRHNFYRYYQTSFDHNMNVDVSRFMSYLESNPVVQHFFPKTS